MFSPLSYKHDTKLLVHALEKLKGAYSTDIIISALLRPSEQYSSQPSASRTANVSNERLISLATRWPISRENGLEFLDLFDGTEPKVDVPPEAATVSHTFYRKGDIAGAAPSRPSPRLHRQNRRRLLVREQAGFLHLLRLAYLFPLPPLAT